MKKIELNRQIFPNYHICPHDTKLSNIEENYLLNQLSLYPKVSTHSMYSIEWGAVPGKVAGRPLD